MNTNSPSDDSDRPSIVPVEPGEIVLRAEPVAPVQPVEYATPQVRDLWWLRSILIVIGGVILVLFAIKIPTRNIPHSGQAWLTAARTDVINLSTALNAFKADTGRYPTSAEGLQAMVTPPNVSNWLGPYVKSVPMDVWGMPYIYQCPGTHNPAGFDLWSYGPDKKPGRDDIKNW